MKRNEKRMAIVPRTLKEAREATQLFMRLVKEAPEMQNEFPATLDLFKVLDKYQIDIADSTKLLVVNLQQAWESYLMKLADAEEMLGNTKEEMKRNLLEQAEKFRNVMKEFLADFLVKLPTSSKT